MEHTSVNRRMIIWIACTVVAVLAAIEAFAFPPNFSTLFYILLMIGAFVVLVINETVFGIRKSQLEIDRDETIKTGNERQSPSPVVLAICPECKSRIPAESKYCLECGADLQSKTI
jgi:uncharacterized protein YlaI